MSETHPYWSHGCVSLIAEQSLFLPFRVSPYHRSIIFDNIPLTFDRCQSWRKKRTGSLVALHCCIDAQVCSLSVLAIFIGSFYMLYNDREFAILMEIRKIAHKWKVTSSSVWIKDRYLFDDLSENKCWATLWTQGATAENFPAAIACLPARSVLPGNCSLVAVASLAFERDSIGGCLGLDTGPRSPVTGRFSSVAR